MTDTTNETGSDNAARIIADLAARAVNEQGRITDRAGDAVAAYVRDVDGNVVETWSLEQYDPTPHRKRGRARFSDTASLLTYWASQHEDASFYADPDSFAVTAVFNDHAGELAGWRDFTAELRLKPTPEWEAWRGIDRRYLNATELAEFVEDWRHTIAEPATADLLELIRTFRATKKVVFRDEIVEKSGDRALEYVTETEAQGKGALAVPDGFTLVLAPFEGAEEQPVEARFRYRLNDGHAGFGVVLEQPDKVARDAFQVELTKITDTTDEPIMVGSPA